MPVAHVNLLINEHDGDNDVSAVEMQLPVRALLAVSQSQDSAVSSSGRADFSCNTPQVRSKSQTTLSRW